jgi:hypothetical protein
MMINEIPTVFPLPKVWCNMEGGCVGVRVGAGVRVGKGVMVGRGWVAVGVGGISVAVGEGVPVGSLAV